MDSRSIQIRLFDPFHFHSILFEVFLFLGFVCDLRFKQIKSLCIVVFIILVFSVVGGTNPMNPWWWRLSFLRRVVSGDLWTGRNIFQDYATKPGLIKQGTLPGCLMVLLAFLPSFVFLLPDSLSAETVGLFLGGFERLFNWGVFSFPSFDLTSCHSW